LITKVTEYRALILPILNVKLGWRLIRATDRQIDRQTDRQTERQKGRKAERQKDRQVERKAERQAGRKKGTQAYSSHLNLSKVAQALELVR